MYMLTVAYMVKSTAGPEFWQAIGYAASDFDKITLGYIVMNLIPVTIGNLLGGGVMVGLSKWFVYLRVKG